MRKRKSMKEVAEFLLNLNFLTEEQNQQIEKLGIPKEKINNKLAMELVHKGIITFK